MRKHLLSSKQRKPGHLTPPGLCLDIMELAPSPQQLWSDPSLPQSPKVEVDA
jgi:hypothetical protein